MQIFLSRAVGSIALLMLVICLSGAAYSAPDGTQPAASKPGVQVTTAVVPSVSQPLRTMPPRKIDQNASSPGQSLRDFLPPIPKISKNKISNGCDESLVQDSKVAFSSAAMPSPMANFDGVKNTDNPALYAPPDTQGAIGIDPATGKKYYIQWVNVSFQIWDVTDPAAPASVYGPAAGNTLWSGFGGLCETTNNGDPITLFDHQANRWVMSQFAFPSSAPPFNDNHQCIAVSTSADPTGTWYRYDFLYSTTTFNDYSKFGVWPDGYYMSVNQYNSTGSSFLGAGAVVFERAKMLNGEIARMLKFDIGAATTNYSSMLPSDFDGAAPESGTPNYFVEWDDSSWLSDPDDTLRIWEFKTDWVTPGNSTFGANTSYDPNYTIATADVDPDLCSYARACIAQPGTANKVDAISDRLMYRLQFRNFGSYKTLVSNHTVDITGADQAGIHWFELRDTGSGWGMFQQGLHAPNSDNRWMGSIAMDGSGNIALGYSVSSATTYPSVRYAGRLASDPLGTLPQGETTMISGSGSQTAGGNRWGDYSTMSVDPANDRTFWYTQQYYATTSGWGWQTRIGSFKFCVDADGDTYGVNCDAGPDCDDNNSAIHAPVTYYRDADGDGFGNKDNASEHCSLTPPEGYSTDNTDCNDNDPFYNKICPDCTVKVIPRALGWFLGEKEKTRRLIIIAPKDTVFDDTTEVSWETSDIAVLSKHVLFKRFMFLKVSIDGAALGKGDYRALIGTCSGKLTLVK